MSDKSGNSQEKGIVEDERKTKPIQYRIITMNVGCGSKPPVPTRDDRKKAIHDFVANNQPHLVLFQELDWRIQSLKGDNWKDFRFDEKYEFHGNYGVVIMYDKNEFKVREIRAGEIPKHISEKMCICLIESTHFANVEFICVTWHGKYKDLDVTNEKVLQTLLECLKNVCRKQKRPILIGGDFNLDIETIDSIFAKVPFQEFKTHPYDPTERQIKKRHVFEFFITMDIDLESVEAIVLQETVFDHDPISAVISIKPNLYDVITPAILANQSRMIANQSRMIAKLQNDIKILQSAFKQMSSTANGCRLQ